MTAPEPAASLMAAIEAYGHACWRWGVHFDYTMQEKLAAHAEVRRLLALTRTAASQWAVDSYALGGGNDDPAVAARCDAARAELVRLLGVDDDA